MIVEHTGVKGMHWGVRKSTSGSKPAKPMSTDAKKVAKLKAKPASALSNKQLKEANERLNLESNYKRLNPSKVGQGRKVASEILATVGIGIAAYNIVKSPAGKAMVDLGKTAISGILIGSKMA